MRRALRGTERGKIARRFGEVDVERLLGDIAALYRFHPVVHDKRLVAAPSQPRSLS